MNAILTSMEAALLRSRGLSQPEITLDRDKWEYRAVIVRQNGRTIEALGRDAETATRNVIRMAVSK